MTSGHGDALWECVAHSVKTVWMKTPVDLGRGFLRENLPEENDLQEVRILNR